MEESSKAPNNLRDNLRNFKEKKYDADQLLVGKITDENNQSIQHSNRSTFLEHSS